MIVFKVVKLESLSKLMELTYVRLINSQELPNIKIIRCHDRKETIIKPIQVQSKVTEWHNRSIQIEAVAT
jgi:hypothetical protein